MRAFVVSLTTIFLLGLIGCNSQPFPGGPGSNGFRDVPFTETFLFDFKTGAGPISRDNPDGNLQIISAADLLTLLNAAQDQQTLGLGVVSGLVLYNGSAVENVALKVTDADGNLLAIRMEGKKIGNNLVLPDGMICPSENVSLDNICIKGSIYYNSPGGVPDFSNNKGTSTAGSYTIFNLPPGDVYLWASRGGRGNARIKVFANKISVGKMQVTPISISTVGVTGSVIEAKDESTAVPQATISVLGTTDPGLTMTSDKNGLYEFVSIGTNGSYLVKVSKSGHWDSYHTLITTPFETNPDIQIDIQDVTKTLTSYSNSYIGEISSQKAESGKGIITGRVKGGDGTPQECAKISVRDADGNDLLAGPDPAVLFYQDGSRSSCPSFGTPEEKNETSTNGLFFIYNLPPGEVFVSYVAQVSSGSGAAAPISSSGGMIVPAFPGVVFVQDMTNSGTNTAQDLSGSVISSVKPNLPVPDAQLTLQGMTAQAYSYNQGSQTFDLSSQAKSNSQGDYSIPKSSDLNNPYPLIGGRSYRVKISKPGYADTYQLFSMADRETKQNFVLSPTATTTNAALGEISGLLIDQATGQTAENVTLRITNLAGNPIAGGEITSSDGTFRIPNVPAGMVNLAVISGDDSGNATLQVYPNGVTYFEFVMTKVIPSQVTVSGAVKDLAGTAVGGSQLRALGKSSVISADGSGHYQGSLESFGRFIIKTQKDGFYDTYNFFLNTGIINNSTASDLYAVSRGQISDTASQAGIVQSSTNGVIVGTTVQSSFLQKTCDTACSLGAGPHTSALGYFNQDTILDIAIANQTAGTVTVLFGDESGGFGSPQVIPVGTDPTKSSPSAIAVGDFDGNGSADLVVANKGENSITVLRGDKHGNFTPVDSPIVDANSQPMVGSNSPLSAPVALVVGFFDSDSQPDIAVVNEGDNSVLVLLGNGNGTFHPAVLNGNILRNGVGSSPKAIVAGDFNQDQRMDIAVSSGDPSSGTITVLLGSTDGTFQPLSDPNNGSPIIIQAGVDPEAMALADFNSDGRLDLAVLNVSANTLSIFIGNTSGGFDPLADSNQKALPPVTVGNKPLGVRVGEFNGDGRADLAIIRQTQTDHSVLILFGNGDGTFTISDPILLGDAPESVLLSDQDRNGLFDLVVIGSQQVISLLGSENPTGNISIEARDVNGARVGEVRYLDSSGQVQTNLSATSATGGFVIFNVPPGLVTIRSANGGVGNSIIDAVQDAVSYARLRTISSLPTAVSINGITYDPVGPPPAGVPVGSVHIQVLGMDVQTQSDSNSGTYSFNTGIDANSEYIVRLCWDQPGQPCQ